MYIRKKITKIENSLQAIIDEISCTTVQGALSNFGANLKIHKKSNFDWNQLKICTQLKYMYMHQKNGEISPSHIW